MIRTNSFYISGFFLLIYIILFHFNSCTGPAKLKVRTEQGVFQLVDRKNFGNSDLLFWSELTDFECKALNEIEKAKQGDPDALFALAIFASGNVRDTATYNTYHRKVQRFIKNIRPKIEKGNDITSKGQILFDEMCLGFYKRRAVDNELKGYKLGQSRLSDIFQSNKYNCVSSSILYIILARYFELMVKGLILPSHVFVQLESDKGKIIEIETTVKSGYNMPHDKAFFNKKRGEWFKQRNLVEASYEDYLRRNIVEPWELIAFNMNNQHTSEERMTTINRNRLHEAMGYIDSENANFQIMRLVVYNNEFLDMNKSEDINSLMRMYKKIALFLPGLQKKWSSNIDVLDRVLLVKHQYAKMLFKSGNTQEGITILYDVLQTLDEKQDNYKLILENSMAIITNTLITFNKENRYEESISLIHQFITFPITQNHLKLQEGITYEYWASYFNEKNEWNKAIEKFINAYTRAEKDEDKNRIIHNIKSMLSRSLIVLRKEQRFEEVITFIGRFDTFPAIKSQVAYLNGTVNEHWASFYWDQKKWESAVEKYNNALLIFKEERDKKRL